MKIKMNLSQLKDFEKEMLRMKGNIKDEMREAMNKAGSKFVAEAKQKTPTDSGQLKGSIRKTFSSPFKTVIVAGAPHAIYVHEGTEPSPGRYVPSIDARLVDPPLGTHPGIDAQPFFDRTVHQNKSQINEEFRKHFETLFRDAAGNI